VLDCVGVDSHRYVHDFAAPVGTEDLQNELISAFRLLHKHVAVELGFGSVELELSRKLRVTAWISQHEPTHFLQTDVQLRVSQFTALDGTHIIQNEIL